MALETYMAAKIKGRRAADTKVKTPLTELTEALNMNAGMIGRRAAVVAASGGLLVGLGMPAASGNEGQVQTDTSDTSAPDYVANESVTVAKAAEKKDDIAIAGSNGFKASEAPTPEPEPTETSRPAPSESSDDSSSDSDESSDDSKEKSEGSGDYPANPSGSIVEIAKQYQGVPYVYGGTSTSGWDCSGFTSYVYKKAGKSIPRNSAAQRAAGTVVPKSEAKPGDLVYRPGHVGIYLGGDQMIDAGSPGSDTSIRSYTWMGSVQFLRY